MSRTGKPNSSNRSHRRARRAIVLLAVIAACLVAVLIILPSSQEPGDAEPAQTPDTGAEPKERSRSEPEKAVEGGRQERPLSRVRVAIVIDDVGYNLEQLETFLDFPDPITLSVLPNLPHSRESARRVVAAGKELILHLPMEAFDGNDPGPGAILTSHSEEEIRHLLDNCFSQVTHAVGMNNHMGSLATADRRVMDVIMDYLQSNQRFFLDSRTTKETVGAAAARAHAVPYLERDIFLDNDAEAEDIRKALDQGVELARSQGYAVLIGHVRNPQIVNIIGRHMPELKRAGVELVTLSALMEEAGEDS